MQRLLSTLFMIVAAIPATFGMGYDYHPQEDVVGVRWDVDDMLGIFTAANTEIIHWTTDGGDNTCTLSAYGWSLSPNTQYYAYYPYSQSYMSGKKDMEAVAVSYKAQLQTQNNSINHLCAYDFMTASAASTDETCHFSLEHLGSILRIECTLAEGRTLRNLQLSADNSIFVTSAAMNVVTGTLIPQEYAKSVSLRLNDIAVGEGEKLVAYMMMPPTDFKNTKLTATLTADDGSTSSASIDGTTVLPGRFYPIELEMPEFSSNEMSAEDAPRYSKEYRASQDASPADEAAETIDHLTAYAPAFVSDSEHRFMQQTDTGIASAERMPMAQDDAAQYTISGIKTAASVKGKVVIRNGRKYVKQ